jgi:hypothetical protein
VLRTVPATRMVRVGYTDQNTCFSHTSTWQFWQIGQANLSISRTAGSGMSTPISGPPKIVPNSTTCWKPVGSQFVKPVYTWWPVQVGTRRRAIADRVALSRGDQTGRRFTDDSGEHHLPNRHFGLGEIAHCAGPPGTSERLLCPHGSRPLPGARSREVPCPRRWLERVRSRRISLDPRLRRRARDRNQAGPGLFDCSEECTPPLRSWPRRGTT